MFSLARDFLLAIKVGVALSALVSHCFGDEPGIDANGQYVSLEYKVDPTPVARQRLPEVWMYSASWCSICPTAKKQLMKAMEDDELPFELVIVDDSRFAPDWVKQFPAFHWGDADTPQKSKKTWQSTEWKGVKYLKSQFEMSRKDLPAPPRPKDTAKPNTSYDNIARSFRTTYVETGLGYTTTRHLIHDHHIPADVVRRYAGNQSALDRLHGFAHTNGR